jgi:hypothetical protein
MLSSGMLRHVDFVRTKHSISSQRACWLLITAHLVPSSPILVTLMMEALHSSEMSVPTRVTWRNIPEGGILHSHAVRTTNLTDYFSFPASSHSKCSITFTCNLGLVQQAKYQGTQSHSTLRIIIKYTRSKHFLLKF